MEVDSAPERTRAEREAEKQVFIEREIEKAEEMRKVKESNFRFGGWDEMGEEEIRIARLGDFFKT